MSKNGKMVMLRAKNQANKATHFIQPQKASKGPLHYQAFLGEKDLGITKFTPPKMSIFKHAVDNTYGKRKGQTQQWGKLVYTSVCSFQLY